jgi:autotransporter-associated beta strand protein
LTGGRDYNFTGAGNYLVTGPILNSTNGAPIGLIKSGSGTLTLTAANTYTNGTTVNGGVLLVHGSITGAVTVAGTATLGGNGIIRGPVTIQTGGKLSPGASIGRLTVSNTVTLNAGTTTLMELDSSVPTNDVLTVSGLFTRNGALLVTNTGPGLLAGDSFDLFNANSQTGGFNSVTLPALASGLRWNTNLLATIGLVSVEAILPPEIVVSLSDGTNFVMQFASQTGASYVLQSTTNIVPPIFWTNDQTNTGTGGSLTFQVPLSAEPQRFFRITAY